MGLMLQGLRLEASSRGLVVPSTPVLAELVLRRTYRRSPLDRVGQPLREVQYLPGGSVLCEERNAMLRRAAAMRAGAGAQVLTGTRT